MVTETIACPPCHQAEAVYRFGYNRGGTQRLRCKDCNKTFTRNPNPRVTTPETQERILKALAERVPINAITRMLRVSPNTVYKVLKKGRSRSAYRTG